MEENQLDLFLEIKALKHIPLSVRLQSLPLYENQLIILDEKRKSLCSELQ